MSRAAVEDNEGTLIEREGFARSLAIRLTGKANPDVVKFLYDWQNRVANQGNYDKRDPFNVRRHGKHREYKTRHDALVGTAHMFHAPRFQEITKDLEGGFTGQARMEMSRRHLGLPYDKLPVPLDQYGDTKPSEGNWATHGVGGALANGAAGIADGASILGGGLSGLLSNPLVLVVGVVLLVVLLKR